MSKIKPLLLAAVVMAWLLSANAAVNSKHSASPDTSALLKREEMMVYNLQRGKTSTLFYLLESLKATRSMERDLERAQNQVEQVDAAYAKAKNRPDDRTMHATSERLKAALNTAQQLEKELSDAREELKSDIKQTLIR